MEDGIVEFAAEYVCEEEGRRDAVCNIDYDMEVKKDEGWKR